MRRGHLLQTSARSPLPKPLSAARKKEERLRNLMLVLKGLLELGRMTEAHLKKIKNVPPEWRKLT